MVRRLILIAMTWAAALGLVAGAAHAQAPAPQGGKFVLVGVVLLEQGRVSAFLQEPSFTGGKVLTVRPGDSVGPYRVTKILSHSVELEGSGGTISVPLAGVPGAVDVASSAGTAQPPAVVINPPVDLSQHPVIALPRGDPRRNFPASRILLGAGAVLTNPSPGWQAPPQAQPAAVPATDVPVPAATQPPASAVQPSPTASDGHPVIHLPRGDPRRSFPTSKMLIGG